MQRGPCVLALLIAWLAIGCGDPTRTTWSTSAVAPDAIGDDDGAGTIMIVPNVISISGPDGILVTAPVSYVGSGASTHLASLAWENDAQNAFDSVDPTCPIGICPYMPTGFMLTKDGTLACTPNPSARSATLRATSNTNATATALVTCEVAGTEASFTAPPSVGRLAAPVGGTTPTVLVVTNNGGEDLMITVALDTGANAAHWTALECTTNACPLVAGDTLQIDLEFSPGEHGDLDSSITVSGPPVIGSQTVDLLGTGVGGKLRVDQPEAPTFEHDFGTIAKNQLVAFQVEMTNVGNDALDVTPGTTTSPFGAATTPVTITEGGQGTFDVTCMSGTAMTQQTATLALGSDAYEQNTPSITVKCAIANTTVLVTNPLDFQELRTGDDPGEIDVVIENPAGSAAVTITRIDLVGAPNALDLTNKPTLPATLAGGEQIAAKLVLATAEDLELVNVTLEVEITEADTVTLELPVTGKVGTPNAVVIPTRLDLGSVCVGTSVEGQITMSNIGSVTLTMQRPTMDSTTFVPLFTNPTDYPVDGAPLLVGDKATVGVMPTSTLPGLQQGTLEWSVDAPNSPFTTDVLLMLVMEGTAVSPGGLMFGSAPITEPPRMQQTIRIENCGPDTSTVRYGGVTAELGTANAWLVDPPTQTRELVPDETMRIRVAFSPNQPGPHRSRLAIDVDGSESIIILEGDATGELPVETSFYACGCSGSADPQRGWPILIAVVLVVRRRRRPNACS